MRAPAWRLLAILLSPTLSTGCADTGFDRPPVVVAPRHVDYAPEVQARAAAELEAAGPPCARDTVFAGCSALARFAIDYGDVRCDVRALRGETDPCPKGKANE